MLKVSSLSVLVKLRVTYKHPVAVFVVLSADCNYVEGGQVSFRRGVLDERNWVTVMANSGTEKKKGHLKINS